MASVTPMMQQYLNIKEQHQDAILFFRLGDFYEMFFDDAHTVSRELELTLTGKDCGLPERAPMCGVPYHSANTYIARLIEKGYKVAICEQMTDPALSKGLVEREVVRIITPGTILDGAAIDERRNNFLLCVCVSAGRAGIAYADVTTGEFYAAQLPAQALGDEISALRPGEIIANDLAAVAPLCPALPCEAYPAAAFSRENALAALREHFGPGDLTAFGLSDEWPLAAQAAGALMRYLNETQKNALEHITGIRLQTGRGTMPLDAHTRRNLELTESLRTRAKRGSLLWLLDRTATAMGGRLLRTWVEQPLTERGAIESRLCAVDALYQSPVLAASLHEALANVYDIERLLSRVSYQSLNARDCLALKKSLAQVPGIRALLDETPCLPLCELQSRLDPLTDLTELLERAIHPDAPLAITEGGIIREGYHAALDELRRAATEGKQWLLDMEAREREATGIKNLKIQYNRVFGYYIEVTKSNYDLVPIRYQRRQTLANCERFITPELSELERKITGAQEQSMRLELSLFADIRKAIAAQILRLQSTAMALKTLDALLSLALVARENGYVRPALSDDGELVIREGRHPVVERTTDAPFVPNDTHMDNDARRMQIITGPNMAGKSTYMRQVALIVLMAHIGSFVPAAQASVPLVDRIFTRIGASDDLAGGQSTFMVEMSETANILRAATAHSLVILDEIGRGTSTFDGLSIAWATVEYLCDKQKVGAKTLFATHYHELSELEGRLEGVENYCISVREHGEDVIFLRKIKKGGADKSFGVYVARLAGVPQPVVARAQEIQARLEVNNINQNAIGRNILEQDTGKEQEQVGLFEFAKTEFAQEVANLDVLAMTPMDALNTLFLLREKARKL